VIAFEPPDTAAQAGIFYTVKDRIRAERARVREAVRALCERQGDHDPYDRHLRTPRMALSFSRAGGFAGRAVTDER
jgi:hypothetical protein